MRRYKDAEQAFDKATEKKPNFSEAWYAHGMALKLQEKYQDAIESFNKAISYYDPIDYDQLSRAWRQLGDSSWYLGEYQDALKAFEKAIDYTPEDFILYNWKADALASLGRYPEALKAIEVTSLRSTSLVCSCKMQIDSPLVVFHSLMLLSSLPLARIFPFGLIATK
ncbi:tetratricopeptide repeat protein [Scytonema sp. UIC 10036]|uniref:tetratricopeptide repeat protein n=1 Tax=Scytonema sp. UIC 10036 TaxID=2304196 RepID=UPI00140F5A2E|nr:tetratricopeptide repeat protein [Scytonema sp. UIC 10036]